MKRFAIMLALTAICGVEVARAQTAATTDKRAYAEATGGLTFGHRTSGSFGAEGGYWLTQKLGLFVEVGRMQNVVTHDMVDEANLIGNFIGATAEPKRHVTYFDVGGTYRFPVYRRMQPYALLGIGFGHVSNDTKFSVGGNDITGSLEDLGVQLGTDLSGSYTRPLVTLGGGIHVPFGPRWLGDVSYRYAWVGKNSDAEIDSLNTNRLQFGFGARLF